MMLIQCVDLSIKGRLSVRTILAWESEEAKEKPTGGGWLYQDRPVARAHWRRLKPHALEGLAVYQVAEGADIEEQAEESSPSREANDGSREGSRRGVRMRRVHGGGRSSVRQLQLEFSRPDVNRVPGQRSLLEPTSHADSGDADDRDEKPEKSGGNGRVSLRDREASSEDLLALAREQDLEPSTLTQQDWDELVQELERRMTKGR